MHILEIWINEVVAQKADGHNERIPDFVRQGFQRSLQANAAYHIDIAKGLTKEEDHALSKYHALMAEIYSHMMCK